MQVADRARRRRRGGAAACSSRGPAGSTAATALLAFVALAFVTGAVARLVDRARRDARGRRPDLRLPGRVRGGPRRGAPRAAGHPGRCSAGLLIATVAVAVWALLTRVFPGDLGSHVLGARLSEPFGYWNALGCMAAIGMPAALWLGTRRGGAPVSSALAYPALGILLLTLLLTQSRGALWPPRRSACRSCGWRRARCGCARSRRCWRCRRWRWPRSRPGRCPRTPSPSSSSRTPRGRRWPATSALMVLALVAVLFAAGPRRRSGVVAPRPLAPMRRRAGFALARARRRCWSLGGARLRRGERRGLGGHDLRPRRRDHRRAGRAARGRGAARARCRALAARLLAPGATEVFEERPSVGRGAGAFGLASLRYRRGSAGAEHAHGFIAQTAGRPRAGRRSRWRWPCSPPGSPPRPAPPGCSGAGARGRSGTASAWP